MVQGRIKREIRKYLEPNKNENTHNKAYGMQQKQY